MKTKIASLKIFTQGVLICSAWSLQQAQASAPHDDNMHLEHINEPEESQAQVDVHGHETQSATETPSLVSNANAGAELQRLNAQLEKLEAHMSAKKTTLKTHTWSWDKLADFQSSLLRAMAYDPAALDDSFIPSDLHPRHLTQMLREDLANLEKSKNVAVKMNVVPEFEDYVTFCHEALDMRDKGLFRKSRILSKRGILEEKYNNLSYKIALNASSQFEVAVVWSEGDRQDILNTLGEVRESLLRISPDQGGVNLSSGKAAVQSIQRGIASVAEKVDNWGYVKNVLMLLIPMVFLTGFLGGVIFRSYKKQR